MLLALALLSGCRRDADVLARVGDRVITVDEFERVGRGNETQYPGVPMGAKTMLLEDMVRRALMLSDAEAHGMYRAPLVQGYRQRVADEILEGAIYDALAPASVPVSDDEVEQFYAWRDTADHVRVIYCTSSDVAAAAAVELGRGADFASIADRYGLPGVVPPGGDLGFLAPGSLVPPLDRYLREAPLHTVIGPVEAPGQGWFLLEVLERQPRAQAPLAEQRALLRDMLRQRKHRLVAVRAIYALREAYGLRLEPGGSQELFVYLNQPRTAPADSTKPGAGVPGLPPPHSEQLATVLARYDAGGKPAIYSFADALDDLAKPRGESPNPSMLPAIERWLESQVTRRITLLEARRRHLDQDPEIAQRIEERVDGYVLNGYYDSEVTPSTEISQEDLHQAYERLKQSFQRLDEVRLLVVTLADSASAAMLTAHAGHVPSLREAVQMVSPGARVTEQTVRYPNAPEFWKPQQAAFMGMSPQECLGPLATKGGWLVAQLVSKQQGPEAFDRLPPSLMQTLRQQADELRRDRKLGDVVTALRRKFPVEVRADRLRDIPWPIAPAAPRAAG